MNYKFLIVILFVLFLIVPVMGTTYITSDEVTETSILWNLTNITSIKTISYIAFDGIKVVNYFNTSKIIQNNLYPSESHIISVNTSDNNYYEAIATTKQSQQDSYLTFINQYILIILVVLIYIAAYFSDPFIAFVGWIIAFIGLTTTLHYSFEIGSIFVILLIVGFFIGVKGD